MLIGLRGLGDFGVPPILPLYPPPGLVSLVHQLPASGPAAGVLNPLPRLGLGAEVNDWNENCGHRVTVHE